MALARSPTKLRACQFFGVSSCRLRFATSWQKKVSVMTKNLV
jgi:hypothetical protein